MNSLFANENAFQMFFLLALVLCLASTIVAVVCYFKYRTAIDLLNKKSAQEAELRETVKSSARMASLGTMVAEIAHELKNPLAILEMNNYQLKFKFEKGKADQSYFKSKIEVYDRMTKRMSKIVGALKTNYQSGDNSDMEIVTIGDIFEEARVLSEMRAEKFNIALSFDEQYEASQVNCRVVQMTQVLQNLIHNAIDAVNDMKDNSEKWVKVETRLVGQSQIEISVADSGPGIPFNIRDRIFDSLFTTKKNGAGTGLGLSISRRFIEEHGGYLDLANQEKTKFIIGLPLYKHLAGTQVSPKKVS